MGEDPRSMAAQPGNTLISHGLDFVLDAVTRLDEHAGEEREARYAVVHLAMGAELLGWDPFRTCPACEEKMFIRVSDDEKETESKCFACGERFDDKHTADCTRCGRLFVPAYEEDDVICPDCFDDVVSGD